MTDAPELIVGAKEIGKFLGLRPRQVYAMRETLKTAEE